jgi:hypothetical protein
VPGVTRTPLRRLERAALATREDPCSIARIANLASFLLGLLVAERDLLAEIVETRCCRPSGAWLWNLVRHAMHSSSLH